MSTSINKFIADSGMCSRREADKLIEKGLVKINGRPAQLGNRVEAGDRVTLKGKPVRNNQRQIYLAYNKPVGIVSTTDRKEPDNILDAINHPVRLFPIGRLDKSSEGLLFLTNDGDIVNKILRAGNEHEKEYEVKVDKIITREFIESMAAGVPILGTVTKPCQIKQVGPKNFIIILTQGLNRQIRRMCEHFDYEVISLKRTRIMSVKLGKLRPGSYRKLTDREMKRITEAIADSSNTEEASQDERRQVHAPKRKKPKKNTKELPAEISNKRKPNPNSKRHSRRK